MPPKDPVERKSARTKSPHETPNRPKSRPTQPNRPPPSRPTTSARLRGSTITIEKPRNLQSGLTLVVQAPKAAVRSPPTATRSAKSPARPTVEPRSSTHPRAGVDTRPKPSARAVTTPRTPPAKSRVDSGLRKDIPASKRVNSPPSGIVKESKVASAFAFWAATSKAEAGDYNPLAASRQKTEYECGACGHVHENRTAYCSACGADLEFQCWTCGMIWKKYVKFCSDCGCAMLPPLKTSTQPRPSTTSSLASSSSFSSATPLAELTPSTSSLNLPSSTPNESTETLLKPALAKDTAPSSVPSLAPILGVSAEPTSLLSISPSLETQASIESATSSRSTSPAPRSGDTEEEDFGEVTELESRQRRMTEAPIIAAAQQLADGKVDAEKEEEPEGTQLSLDLSQYSSVNEMVEMMLLSKHLAISFRNIFFNTLHLFSTPQCVLEQAIRVLSFPFESEGSEVWTQFVEWTNSKLKGYSVLKNWLAQFPQDFDDAMKTRVVDWLSEGLPASWRPPQLSEGKWAEAMNGELLKLSEARSRCLTEARQTFAELLWIRKSIPVSDPFTRFFTSVPCWPELAKLLKEELVKRPLNLLDKKPRDIASQLTLLQIKRMLMVPGARAFLKGGSKLIAAPSQMKISNSISCWVACEVLKHNTRKEQAAVFHHFVQVAKECYTLRNFATVFEIVYGLNQHSVYRLRGDKTNGGIFEKLSRQTRGQYDTLIEFANPSNNYGAYRKVVQTIVREGKADCWAPYLGVLLKDLVTIEEGGKPLKLNVRVEETEEEEDDSEVLIEIVGAMAEEGKSKEEVYVLFDKCREMSRNVSEALACCHNYPIFPIAGAGGLLAASDATTGESRQQNLFGVSSKERKTGSYDKLVPDEGVQLQLLEAIMNAMTVEQLDARSLEILPRKSRS